LQHDTLSEAETAGIRDRFRKLTRSLSIAGRRRTRVFISGGKVRVADSDSDSETEPEVVGKGALFDCVFIAGIYHDQVPILPKVTNICN
jgi:hypothetical protein